MKLAYRPEIDGMRAIAVVAVVIYHLKITAGGSTVLSGGFLGVDLFFVLSGFLITKILLQELSETGRVGFGNFYARRARRILPPLLLVMLVSLPFAVSILLPSELARFGMSLLAALGFVSNVFWFFSLGEYGAQSGLLQPFLHTWSLAIEEQFYLIFPILLIWLHRIGGQRAIWVGIWVVFALSLILSQATTAWKPDLSFFSPVSRAWELLAGSALAYLSLNRPDLGRTSAVARVIPSLAMVVLLGSFVLFDLDNWPHPGLWTLPVIAASCALLWFAQPGEPVTALLSTPPFVFIGKLSYSIYLWHFPVFAFGRLSSIDGATLTDKLLWVAITFALSVGGYYLVERPFRFRVPTRVFGSVMAAALAVVVIFGGLSHTNVLTSGKQAQLEALYGENGYDNEALALASWSILDDLAPDEDISGWNAHTSSRHEERDDWFTRDDSRKVIILGNSHGKDVFNALYLNADAFEGVEFARFGMNSTFTQEKLDLFLQSPNFLRSDVVALAPRYGVEFIRRLPELIDPIIAAGKEVVIIGNTAQFTSPGNLPVFDWYLQQSGDPGSLSQLNSFAYGYEDRDIDQINQALRAIAEDYGIPYLSRRDLLCSDQDRTCTQITPDGRKALYDYGHWTLEGAAYFGSLAARNGWFQTP